MSSPASPVSAPANTPPPARPLPVLGLLAVLGSAALFGTLGPLSRLGYEMGLEPAAWVAWRALIGLVALGAFIAWRSRRGTQRVVRLRELTTSARTYLLLAAVMGFLLNLFMFYAFERVTVALVLLGFYTYPAMVAVVNVALRRERLDTARVVALGFALLGMTTVVASQLDPAAGIRVDALGIGLALGAAVSQTVYVTISQDGYSAVPTVQAMALVLLVTAVGSAAVAILTGAAASLVPPMDAPALIPILLFVGVFGAAVPSIGFLAGIRAIGGLRAGILMLFEPVVGVALAAWLLSEDLAPIQVLGAVAILGAAVILQRTARPVAESAPHAVVAVGGGS